MDYSAFVNGQKTLLISPAGYGKTHTIAECLKYTKGRQLILTHTHAGVSSLKEKIRKFNIPTANYSIETISSFAQKYTFSFYNGTDLPVQKDPIYHIFVLEKATRIIGTDLVKSIIKATYGGLFVDEYQDCSKSQHKLIMKLSSYIPTHILGDPLQGIFDFNDEIVNLETDLKGFTKFPDLDIPYRWYREGNNKNLGDAIKEFRKKLIKAEPISVASNSDIGLHVLIVNQGDINNTNSDYRRWIARLLKNPNQDESFDSLLLIVPEYEMFQNGRVVRKGDIGDRVKLVSRIDPSHSLTLLEAIDDRKYYITSSKADELIDKVSSANKPIKKIYDFLGEYFLKSGSKSRPNTGMDDWFSIPHSTEKTKDYAIKNKQGNLRSKAMDLRNWILNFIESPSKESLYNLVKYFSECLSLRRNRRIDLYYSMLKSIKNAIEEDSSISDAMAEYKNKIRRVGRRIEGKCIGTTLLTKGLEFDTVAILDADKFTSPKHLYVALSRCSKKLIIFTENNNLLKNHEKGSPLKTEINKINIPKSQKKACVQKALKIENRAFCSYCFQKGNKRILLIQYRSGKMTTCPHCGTVNN